MGRSPCCSKEGLNRGAWTAQEDKILREYIRIHGEGKWRNLPKGAGLKRCGKSCRLRWLNYLRPDIKRGNISPDEEELIIRLHKLLGNRWSLIAGRLPGRTDNEIKNYWNTNLGRRVQDQQFNESNSKPAMTVSSSPAKMAPFAIRTKAFRCSKVLISTAQPNSCQYFEAKAGVPSEGHKPAGKTDELLSFPCGEGTNVNPSSDFMNMNFNMGDICLSDLLNSDFSYMCDFNYGDDNSNDVSPSSDQPLMLSEEMLQDWSTVGNCIQTNESPNLQSFASLVGSEEEWLGE